MGAGPAGAGLSGGVGDGVLVVEGVGEGVPEGVEEGVYSPGGIVATALAVGADAAELGEGEADGTPEELGIAVVEDVAVFAPETVGSADELAEAGNADGAALSDELAERTAGADVEGLTLVVGLG